MFAMPKTLSQAFKLSFKRKARSGADNRYPLSLSATEVNQLKELLRAPGWAAYRTLLERYAELRAQRLLQPLPLDQTNVERGAIAAIFEIAALPDTLLKRLGDHDDRLKRDGAGNDPGTDFYWQWGAELFRDRFRHP